MVGGIVGGGYVGIAGLPVNVGRPLGPVMLGMPLATVSVDLESAELLEELLAELLEELDSAEGFGLSSSAEGLALSSGLALSPFFELSSGFLSFCAMAGVESRVTPNAERTSAGLGM